jgi:hypothetical protein
LTELVCGQDMLSVIKLIDDTSLLAPKAVFAMLTTETLEEVGLGTRCIHASLAKLNLCRILGMRYSMTNPWQRKPCPVYDDGGNLLVAHRKHVAAGFPKHSQQS